MEGGVAPRAASAELQLSPAAQEEERALVRGLRAGDPAAFEVLVRCYAGRMREAALRILQNEEDAADAVQEAFVSAFRALERFEEKARVGTWLQRIAINAALMRLRSRRNRHEQDVEELLPEFHASGPFVEQQGSWAELPEDPLVREELCEHVRRHIAELPDKFRIPLLLRDIEGLDNAELARELGVTVNAAKIRVHRARQALRALLEPRMIAGAP